MKTLSVKSALKLNNTVFIDTRSPKEHNIDTMPGSVNLYILDNEQRHAVGLLYKSSKEEGIELGYEYYNKNVPRITSGLENIDKSKTLIVFCWRGGMRSKTITEFALKLGFNAVQLEGGYKEYRAFIRSQLEKYTPPKFIVLYGLAGSRKTELIKKLTSSIDLEGFAKHRSSLFGAIGLIPNSQKKFETLLYFSLEKLKNNKYIFIEGESRKIGDLFIPNNIFKAMGKGIAVKVNCSIDKRCEQIVKDYFVHGEDDKIKQIILSLKEFLTKKTVDKLHQLIDSKEYKEVSRILLEDYYDLRYKYNTNHIDVEVCSDNLKQCVRTLQNKFEIN